MTDSHDGDGSDRDPPPSERSSDEDFDSSDRGPPSGSRPDEDESGAETASPGDDSVDETVSDRESDGGPESTGGETDGGRPPNPERSGAGSEAGKPAPEPGSREAKPVPAPGEDPIEWFRRTDNEAVIVFKDVASSVGIVVAVGLLLFGVSGVWPPLVAIESGSMNPHMQKGDLVFIMEEDRMEPDAAVGDTGVVTYRQGQETGYKTFGDYGDVIVFQPNGKQQTPIIHRAMFYVEEGESWYAKADKDHVNADSCEELGQSACEAPYSGFVTKGDNPRTNQQYDQANQYQIVKPEWIKGTAEVRLPYLGCIRLEFSGTASCRPLFGATQPVSPESLAERPSLSSRTPVAAPTP